MRRLTKLSLAFLLVALVIALPQVAAVGAQPTRGIQERLNAPWTAWYADPRAKRGPEWHSTTLDADNNVVAVGTDSDFNVALGGELIMAKYDQQGQLINGWPRFFSNPDNIFNEGQDVIVDPSGNLIVTGYVITSGNLWRMATWKFDSGGNIITGWPQYQNPNGQHAFGTEAALDSDGNIVCCGGSGATGYDNLVLMKYRPDGTGIAPFPLVFQVAPAQRTFGFGIIQDSDGNYVVSGYTDPGDGSHQAVLYKFDRNGLVIAGWPKIWDSGVGNFDDYWAVSQDGSGDYCIVGRTGGTTNSGGTDGTDGKLLVTRYSKDGNQVAGWPVVYNQGAFRDNTIDVWRGAVDPDGNIAAATTCKATSSTAVHTVKYTRGGAMAPSFPQVLGKGGYHVETRSCNVDGKGNIYSVGYAASYSDPDNNYSTFIAKYAPGPYVCYFAEGTTRSNPTDGAFEEWLCLQNAGTADANVTLTYMLADGSTRTQKEVVAKATRKTISVNAAIGAEKDVSTVVTSDQPIVAERPMYFNYRSKWTGGHIVMGVSQPLKKWYFAEGTTRENRIDGSYDEWLCMQNPGAEAAEVQVTYMLETGQTIKTGYTVNPTSRRTVDVSLAVGKNHDVSMVLESDKPIVAERPMYFNYRNKWTGGHDVVASPGPDTTFYFAEGTTRTNPADGAFEEWICIQNPNAVDTGVHINYWTDQAGVQTQDVRVKANSRATVDVKLRLGANVDTSFKITSDDPVLVERPMYFNYHSAWDGGHDVMGCAGPKKTFYFAEGNTLPDFAMYLAMLNPGSTPATVNCTYMIEGEANRQVTHTLQPQKRFTLDVKSEVGLNKNVSVLLESDQAIVAERPMYFFYHGWCTGGHDTLGLGI